MKITRVLDLISKPRVVFICVLIGHQNSDKWQRYGAQHCINCGTVELSIVGK